MDALAERPSRITEVASPEPGSSSMPNLPSYPAMSVPNSSGCRRARRDFRRACKPQGLCAGSHPDKGALSTPFLPPYDGLCHAGRARSGWAFRSSCSRNATLPAHAAACVHRVLDICENYLGFSRPWFFQPYFERLEIILNVTWNNAQSGFGFLELGEDDGGEAPFSSR